ncbi:hypothetical protein JCGZ_08320 [Jatropha curcas]|uniref:Uncharacterized protein n=1 Tax=Jatropha curcas TaxID=180498 RepID=A0A067KNG1_JATCU|nr:hypothetical protein JCGZ_08320 [Jatropha curcas]
MQVGCEIRGNDKTSMIPEAITKSEIFSKNRGSEKGGEGSSLSLYVGGSISALERQQRMAKRINYLEKVLEEQKEKMERELNQQKEMISQRTRHLRMHLVYTTTICASNSPFANIDPPNAVN